MLIGKFLKDFYGILPFNFLNLIFALTVTQFESRKLTFLKEPKFIFDCLKLNSAYSTRQIQTKT